MNTIHNKKSINTITGVFSTIKDADNAYHALLEFGYKPYEITLIMSEETHQKLFTQHDIDFYLNSNSFKENGREPEVSSISDALDVFGRFVAIPGLSLVVAGNFTDGGFRALSGSVMSDEYAAYFQSRIKEGEILIDFSLHTVSERNYIINLWEYYGGFPLVRKVSHAA